MALTEDMRSVQLLGGGPGRGRAEGLVTEAEFGPASLSVSCFIMWMLVCIHHPLLPFSSDTSLTEPPNLGHNSIPGSFSLIFQSCQPIHLSGLWDSANRKSLLQDCSPGLTQSVLWIAAYGLSSSLYSFRRCWNHAAIWHLLLSAPIPCYFILHKNFSSSKQISWLLNFVSISALLEVLNWYNWYCSYQLKE